jgi:hypothetical protein
MHLLGAEKPDMTALAIPYFVSAYAIILTKNCN